MATVHGKLTIADIAVIVVYIVSVISVGIWSMFQSKRGTVGGYFLAGRLMTFIPVGVSLFASNIGSEHLVGLAGSGAAAGIGVGAFEFNSLLFLQLLGFVFLPVYIASRVYTLPEYIHKRFGGNRIRIFLSILSLILYIFTKISVNMYSGALFIQQSVGWNLYISILGLLLLTGLCTVTGGLATVIYLDTLMGIVMVGGASIMTYIGFEKIGGYSGLRSQYMNAVADDVLLGNTTCGIPRHDSFILLRDPIDSDIPWPGFLFGQSTASIWYWCADQVIVQRALAAKSLSHAQGGTLLAGYLKILPPFIMVLPGLISRVLFPNEIACVDPEKCYEICGSRSGCTNIAMPKLVLEIMPSGLRGMMLAVMMAALMSDLTSIFNSASTLFTMDIYRSIRKKASNKELMIVGRLFIVLLCIVGIAWVPIMKELQGAQLYLYIQAVASYFSPPIAAVYLLAILWKRSNEKGTFWAMIIGFFVGICRMVIDFSYSAPACGEIDTRPAVLKNFHYFYFAMLLFVITVIICIVVSLLTDPSDEELIIRTTVWTKYDDNVRSDEFIDDLKEEESEEEAGKGVRSISSVSASYHSFHIKESDEYIKEQDPIFKQTRYSCWKRLLYFICGISFDNNEIDKQSKNQHKEHFKNTISLEQNPWAKKFLYVNLIVVLLICFFFHIYLSIPDGGPTSPTIEIPNKMFIRNGTRLNIL